MASIHGLAQFFGSNPLSLPGDLHVGRMRRLVAAQHHRGAAHSLTSNKTNFHPRVVRLDSNDRCDASFHKDYGFDGPVGPLNVFVKRQHYPLKVRLQQREISRQKRPKEAVSNRRRMTSCGNCGHSSLPIRGKSTARSLNRPRPKSVAGGTGSVRLSLANCHLNLLASRKKVQACGTVPPDRHLVGLSVFVSLKNERLREPKTESFVSPSRCLGENGRPRAHIDRKWFRSSSRHSLGRGRGHGQVEYCRNSARSWLRCR